MFGTSDPDLRALSDEGKIWYDELSRLMGSGNKGKAEAFAKKRGKSDLRDVGLMTRSGGYPASRHRGKGPGSGGYPAQGSSSARPSGDDEGEGERRPGTDKASGDLQSAPYGLRAKGGFMV